MDKNERVYVEEDHLMTETINPHEHILGSLENLLLITDFEEEHYDKFTSEEKNIFQHELGKMIGG
jgi:hypothetical protein